MNKYGKLLVPFITPFDKNEDVNYDVFEQLVDLTIRRGFVDTVIVTGTTGEFNTLTFEERVELYRRAVKIVNGRCPIIAGTGCPSTRETIALTRKAVEVGIETCMVVAPYYCKPTQEAIYDHFMAVANQTNADILLYNIPIFTGVNMEPDLVSRLARHPRIIGIKDEAGLNPIQLTAYYYATQQSDPDFLLFNGDDLMLMPTIAQGAVGIVSGGAMLLGDKIRKVFECYERGENDQALALYREIYKLPTVCGIHGRIHPNSILREAITKVTGLPVGAPRRPLDSIRENEKEPLYQVLRELNLIK